MSSEEQNNRDLPIEKGANQQPPSVFGESELDFMRDFVQMQREQIVVRQEELEIQKQQVANERQGVENAHEYALANLKAMVEDRKDARGSGRTARRDRLMFAACVIAALIFFLGFAMYLNKDQIAFEVLKAVGYLIAGALGGYSYRGQKSSEAKSKEE